MNGRSRIGQELHAARCIELRHGLPQAHIPCLFQIVRVKVQAGLCQIQKKTTLTKEALIHARDLDYIGKRTFLGNYSLTEEEFSKLKKQADHGYMMDVENRRLKEELSTAKKEAVRWSNKYHDLWYDVKPYLDALHRAPELVRGFLEKILAPKQEHTMNVPQQNRKRGQDMEL